VEHLSQAGFQRFQQIRFLGDREAAPQRLGIFGAMSKFPYDLTDRTRKSVDERKIPLEWVKLTLE